MSRARHRSRNTKRAKDGKAASSHIVPFAVPLPLGHVGKSKVKGKRRAKAEGKAPGVRADKQRRGIVAVRHAPPSVGGPFGRADGGPVGGPPRAVAAHLDAAGRVVIDYSDGSSELRDGGTLSWRDNNPGNMQSGRFTSTNGAIGENQNHHPRQAIFPDSSTGTQAMRNRLTSPEWAGKTLQEAIDTWAPARGGNDPVRYGAFVSGTANVPPDTRLDSLSSGQLDSVADAMKRYEGWCPGQSTKVYPP
jgi:hypothetical protein